MATPRELFLTDKCEDVSCDKFMDICRIAHIPVHESEPTLSSLDLESAHFYYRYLLNSSKDYYFIIIYRLLDISGLGKMESGSRMRRCTRARALPLAHSVQDAIKCGETFNCKSQYQSLMVSLGMRVDSGSRARNSAFKIVSISTFHRILRIIRRAHSTLFNS